jgi:hypothetical protein
MVAGQPHQGGATWAALQYVLGLRRLGHDVVFVEPVGESFDPVYASAVVDAFGLFGSVAFTGGRETLLGIPFDRLCERDYDVVVNLSGLVRDDELIGGAPIRIYVDLDPAFTQLWHDEGVDVGLAGHTHFVTVGLALGSPSCHLPLCGVEWMTTLPPVVLSRWTPADGPGSAWTTVGNWRSYGSIERHGVRFGQRAHSMRELLDVPILAGRGPEVALAIDPAEDGDRSALADAGWKLVDPVRSAGTPARYRSFVRSSRAELGIAKEGYVVSRCGWFSDRSACYLASGRPVVAQDTGFGSVLPASSGLVTFRGAGEAADAMRDVELDYARHQAAARSLAVEAFDSRIVLERLLSLAGAA